MDSNRAALMRPVDSTAVCFEVSEDRALFLRECRRSCARRLVSRTIWNPTVTFCLYLEYRQLFASNELLTERSLGSDNPLANFGRVNSPIRYALIPTSPLNRNVLQYACVTYW
jgi:hypothetical protein